MTFSQSIIPVLTPSSDIRCYYWRWWSKENFGGWLLEWDSTELKAQVPTASVSQGCTFKIKANHFPNKTSHCAHIASLERGTERKSEREQTNVMEVSHVA